MNHKSAVSQAQNAMQANMPAGYEVKKVGFQQWNVVKNGQVVAQSSSQRHAVDCSWRHSMGQPV